MRRESVKDELWAGGAGDTVLRSLRDALDEEAEATAEEEAAAGGGGGSGLSAGAVATASAALARARDACTLLCRLLHDDDYGALASRAYENARVVAAAGAPGVLLRLFEAAVRRGDA